MDLIVNNQKPFHASLPRCSTIAFHPPGMANFEGMSAYAAAAAAAAAACRSPQHWKCLFLWHVQPSHGQDFWFFLTQDPLPWNHVLKRGNPSSLSSMVHLLIHVAPPGKKNTFAWISWQDYSKLIFIFLIGPDFAALCALGAMLQTTLKMDWRRHWNVFCLREAPQCT